MIPVAEEIFRQQAERLGKTWPMNFADNALMFRSGNPKPKGSAEEILAALNKAATPARAAPELPAAALRKAATGLNKALV